MRVMTVFSGPSIKPGQVKDLGMQTDLFATFSQLAGFDHPDTAEDSYDLTETLKHHSPGPRNFIPFYSGSELRAPSLLKPCQVLRGHATSQAKASGTPPTWSHIVAWFIIKPVRKCFRDNN